jgi:hypothetical protein
MGAAVGLDGFAFARDPELDELGQSHARGSAAARHAHGQVLAALEEKHAACFAAPFAAAHHRPAIAVAARIGHAARKVIFAALRGAIGGITEAPVASARVPHPALHTIVGTFVADNTRPLPIALERRGRCFGGDKQDADCGD